MLAGPIDVRVAKEHSAATGLSYRSCVLHDEIGGSIRAIWTNVCVRAISDLENDENPPLSPQHSSYCATKTAKSRSDP